MQLSLVTCELQAGLKSFPLAARCESAFLWGLRLGKPLAGQRVIKPAGREGASLVGFRGPQAAGDKSQVPSPGKNASQGFGAGAEQWKHPGARRLRLPSTQSPGFPALASRPRPPPYAGPSPMPHEVLPLVTPALAVASFLVFSKRISTISPLVSRVSSKSHCQWNAELLFPSGKKDFLRKKIPSSRNPNLEGNTTNPT